MPSLTCYIEAGDKETWIDSVRMWIKHQKAKSYVLTVEHIKSKRSNAQNRYFYALCRDFVELAQTQAVYGKDLSHWDYACFKGLFSAMYLTVEDPKSGIKIVKGTSQLSVEEFAKFLDKVIRDFVDNGGIIMDKDELYTEAMGK